MKGGGGPFHDDARNSRAFTENHFHIVPAHFRMRQSGEFVGILDVDWGLQMFFTARSDAFFKA
jgi:hypothetical protein